MGILPAAGVFLLCVVWGASKSSELKKHALLLSELIQMTTEFSIAIRCTAPTLDELSQQCSGVFGELLRGELSSSADIRSAWEKATERLAACSFCADEEAAILRELSQELGTCAADGQLSLLEMHREKLSQLYSQAEQDRKTRGKLFRSVGTLTGLGAAILIL